ncbi:hypothetical protein C8R46DRAFT_1294135 [Mycena filopes]|nr:hypothetical protein C8R46DRAFT_1294135 [Mycena filopes]
MCCDATSGSFGARYHEPHPRHEPLRPAIGLDTVPLAPLPRSPILSGGHHPSPPTISFPSSTRKSSNAIPPTTRVPGTRPPQRARPALASPVHARQALARNVSRYPKIHRNASLDMPRLISLSVPTCPRVCSPFTVIRCFALAMSHHPSLVSLARRICSLARNTTLSANGINDSISTLQTRLSIPWPGARPQSPLPDKTGATFSSYFAPSQPSSLSPGPWLADHLRRIPLKPAPQTSATTKFCKIGLGTR